MCHYGDTGIRLLSALSDGTSAVKRKGLKTGKPSRLGRLSCLDMIRSLLLDSNPLGNGLVAGGDV